MGRLLRWPFIAFLKLRDTVRRFDASMRRFFRPRLLALLTVGVIALTMSITLFVPPYNGVSNDGSLDNVLADAGLASMSDPESAYFDYYEREYRIEPDTYHPGTTPRLLLFFIRAAIALDTYLTQDGIFDMRALALIYMLLYLALLYPAILGILRRTPSYSAALLLAVFCALVFGDTTITVRFASLYTAPLEAILLLCLLDAALLLSAHTTSLGLLPIPAIGSVLLMSLDRYCVLAGPVFAMTYWMQALRSRDMAVRIGSVLLALALCFAGVAAGGALISGQTLDEKYDQMTRGVLFESDDPEETLRFFGIDARYTVLTDSYSTQSYPIATIPSGALDEGFLDRYDTGSVLLYYVTHPLALLGMLDVGVHRAFITRNEYSGNYERDAGLPPRAKALLVSLWSTLKEQSAPRTAGLLLLMMLLFLYLRRRGRDESAVEDPRLLNGYCIALFVFAILELLTVAVMSGDSELVRESFIMSYTIDITAVLVVMEILHRTRSIDKEKE